MNAVFFASSLEFRQWLERHSATHTELWVRLRKVQAPGPGLTYAEALDQVLCFGWIDGTRRNLDETSFATRFSPRKRVSIWSKVNLRH